MAFMTASGKAVGPIGQGTWYLGENPTKFEQEKKALQTGIEAGMNLIDTAEMYGEGAAERLVGAAIQGYKRDDLFIVSKVYPHNAGRRNIYNSCENSLRRMKTDHMDLYLLHWRGSIPFQETIDCMEDLKKQGKILNWGVSNLDLADMEELAQCRNGKHCLTDQVLYHLGSRGVEYDLLPYLQAHDMMLMAYCPLAQAGRLRRGILGSSVVTGIAANHNATPQQIMLAFLLTKKNVIPIPRTGVASHTLQNAKAAEIVLTEEEKQALDRAYPAPDHPTPLDMQ